MISKTVKQLCLILVVVIFLSMGTLASDFPVTITDGLGFEITLDKKPERIISLAPNNTEMLFALGLDQEIVGVTTFANYPAAALNKEKIGTITDPNIEKIISLKPDLVVAAGINKMETIQKLKELGISVVGFYPSKIDDIFIEFKRLGKITGKEETARELVTDLYIKIGQIQLLVDKELKNKARQKVFYEIWNQPLYTAGKNTFIDDVITIAGGINIGSKAPGNWPQYSLEMLLIEDPDIYISSPHSSTVQVTEDLIKKRPNYRALKAINNNRIYIVNQDLISRPSPRIIEGIKEITSAIFPELAEELELIVSK